MNDSLVTNEVKDASGTEVEFVRLKSEGRTKIWKKKVETYNLPHRITLSHEEKGVGLKKMKRSLLRVDKTTMSDVDTTLPITNSAYIVQITPVGAMGSQTEAKNVLSELGSLAFTLASSTFLYDGTGNGSVNLLDGSLD